MSGLRDASAPLTRNRGTVVGLVALALIAYLPGFWWGSPYPTAADRTHAWGVDDESPIGTLGQVYNFIDHSTDRNFGYPRMHPIMVTAFTAPYLGYLWLSGQVDGVSAEFPFGLRDPAPAIRTLATIGHLLSVLLAVGVVLAAYAAATLAWDRTTGVLAALFMMTTFPMFYYARTGNVDVPVLFFIALGTMLIARCMMMGFTTRLCIALGATIGLALATKESALGVFLAVPILYLARALRDAETELRSWAAWRPAAWGLVAAFLALGLGSGLFLDPRWYWSHVMELSGRLDYLASGEAPVIDTHPFTIGGNLGFLRIQWDYLVDAMTLPGLALSFVGVVWVFRHARERLFLALPALTYFVFMFVALRSGQLRYIMPLTLFLCLYSGRAVTLALRSTKPWVRVGVPALAAGTLLVGALRGAQLTHQMLRDSRYAASEWLAANTEAGDRIEYFGAVQKLPWLKAGVVTAPATPYYGMYRRVPVDEAAASSILAAWEERRPRYVIVIPDHTSTGGLEHSFTLPPPLFSRLTSGAGPYREVAFFRTPRLMPWLPTPDLDYPTVNPPIRVFARQDGT